MTYKNISIINHHSRGSRTARAPAKINAAIKTVMLGIEVLSSVGTPGISNPVLTGSIRKPPRSDQIKAGAGRNDMNSPSITKGQMIKAA